MKILITGGTGFVGRYLVKRLENDESVSDIYLLVRSIEKAQSKFNDYKKVHLIEWTDIFSEFELNEKELDTVINLMGAGIADKRWSNERKKEIYNSRVDGTKNLIEKLKSKKIAVRNMLQMSAVGIYKQSSSPIDEAGEQTDDFLGKLCQDWEAALTNESSYIANFCILRPGVILGKNGGAMDKMLPVFKLGLGGKLGSGDQYMPWIHVEDLVSIIQKNLKNTEKKIYNTTSPFVVTNSEFTDVLGDLLNKPTVFAVPKFGLRIAAGEVSQALLANHHIFPKKLKEEKFIYRYPTLENALKEVVSK